MTFKIGQEVIVRAINGCPETPFLTKIENILVSVWQPLEKRYVFVQLGDLDVVCEGEK